LVFRLGDRLRHRRLHGPDGWATLAWLVQRFRRHGAAWLVLNRFLPGIRSLFFVAAGMAGMRARAVLLYSALSSLLWNLGLIALGAALGADFDTLLHWVRAYILGAGTVLAAIAALWLVRVGWRRRRKQARP